MSVAPRYVVNLFSGVVHDSRRLTERCNTDQIALRRDYARWERRIFRLQGWRPCLHCRR